MTWREIPFHMNPVALDLGFFQIRWYSLMYLIAFGFTWLLVSYRIRSEKTNVKSDILSDLFFWSILGVVLGGRLGYVLFYDLSYFIRHPLEIILPFQFEGGMHFTGISGMSYHGGMLGVFITVWLFARSRSISFLELGDLLAPAIPLGYTFGRLGNFINSELYGRVTTSSWGMVFPTDPERLLRHPSQLYEAVLEGLVLFSILWLLRHRFPPGSGRMIGFYMIGYALVRTLVEFFRQPDEQIGFLIGGSTMGQLLSLGMFLIGLVMLLRGGRSTHPREE